MKKEIFVPLFPGFYSSIFEPDEEQEIEHVNDKREEKKLKPVDFDEFQFDYKSYQNEVSEGVCSYIENQLNKLGLKCKLEFVAIDSPREYNFRTDRIVANIECSWSKLRKLFLSIDEDHTQWILNDSHKSRPGFISFYPYKLEDWEKYNEETADENVICTMIETILTGHIDAEFDEMDMYYHATQDVSLSASNYDELVNYPNPSEYVEKMESWGIGRSVEDFKRIPAAKPLGT